MLHGACAGCDRPPLFAFGFGLSYTTFQYTRLVITRDDAKSRAGTRADSAASASRHEAATIVRVGKADGTAAPPPLTSPSGPQSLASHGDGHYVITFDVRNVGVMPGRDVPQLYVGFPDGCGEPPRLLRGFTRTTLLAPTEVTRLVLDWATMYFWFERIHKLVYRNH